MSRGNFTMSRSSLAKITPWYSFVKGFSISASFTVVLAYEDYICSDFV